MRISTCTKVSINVQNSLHYNYTTTYINQLVHCVYHNTRPSRVQLMWTEHLTTNLVKEKTQGVNLKALGACCKAAIRAHHHSHCHASRSTYGDFHRHIGSCKSTLSTNRRAWMNTHTTYPPACSSFSSPSLSSLGCLSQLWWSHRHSSRPLHHTFAVGMRAGTDSAAVHQYSSWCFSNRHPQWSPYVQVQVQWHWPPQRQWTSSEIGQELVVLHKMGRATVHKLANVPCTL